MWRADGARTPYDTLRFAGLVRVPSSVGHPGSGGTWYGDGSVDVGAGLVAIVGESGELPGVRQPAMITMLTRSKPIGFVILDRRPETGVLAVEDLPPTETGS